MLHRLLMGAPFQVWFLAYVVSHAFEPLRPPRPRLPPPLPPPDPILVELVPPRICVANGCTCRGILPVALSSRYHLFLCPDHALAWSLLQARWRLPDPKKDRRAFEQWLSRATPDQIVRA